jgi:glucose-1-phosphate cytidylyltransferase
MKIYAQHGFREFVLCLGYRGDMIKKYFLNYEAMNNDFTMCLGQKSHIEYHGWHEEQDFQVTLAETGQDTQTGGRVKRIRKYIEDDTFLLTYGDGLTDANIADIVAFHKAHGKLATVTAVRPISRYGNVTLDAQGKVETFMEKPRSDGWISAGFLVFHRSVFDYIGGDECILERETLDRLATDGQLMAYRHDGFFYAMDTYREYQYLNEVWNTGAAPWKVWK